MKKRHGFSLAEALITLLIVSLIAIVTAPVITKKTRKDPDKVLWAIDNSIKTVVYPNGKRDIMLGDTNNNSKQGIVVSGTMYFKDRNGNVIGWISEDGSNSFAQNYSQAPEGVQTGNNIDYAQMMENQKMIMETLNTLQQTLKNGSPNHSAGNQGFNSSSNAAQEKLLQQQIENIMKSMNKNVYGR